MLCLSLGVSVTDSPAGGSTFPVLTVKGGALDGRSMALDHSMEVSLGSGSNCHFRLELANVEAEHARVIWDDRGVFLSDYGTASGTFVNGEKIAADQPLKDGDRICLGPPGSNDSARIVVSVPEGAAAGQGAAPLVLEAEPEPVILDAAEGAAPEAIIMDVPEPEPAQPAPPPPKPEPRKATRPDYMSDAPSMVPLETDGVSVPAAEGEAPLAPRSVAKAPPAARAKAGRLGGLPRPVLFGGIAAVVALGAFLALRVFHKPPPVLTSITPPRAEAGQTITLGGTAFETDPARNTVRFGELAGQVSSASETQLTVAIPDVKVASGSTNVSVTVESHGIKSNALFFKVYAQPKVATLEPDVAMPGDEVLAGGKNLAGQPLTVTVGGQSAEVVDAKPAALRFRVPSLNEPQGRNVPVQVQVGSEAGKPVSLLIGRLPLIVQAVPPRGMAGERVVLKGRGFDPHGPNVVTFAGREAIVLAASPTELTVLAPGLGTDAQTAAPVVVHALDKTSTSELSFILTRPPASVYAPRYFPAPVLDHAGHDHAFVSTELGPLLLLTGKADAPSTAERAERVASALNALAEAAAGGKLAALEARDKPEPGVFAAGSPTPLVAATAADAGGYDEPWDPSAKPRRSAPLGVAAYWSALLQDYMRMFVLHQRPFRAVELSPRAKVLADLYGDSARRSGTGAGIPLPLVSPLSPAMAKAFREMALLLPAEGQSRPAAAVEGRWAGTMEEPDTGAREISLRLRMDGGRLAGSLTAKAGGLAMDIPLREAAYEKGTLRFVLVMRGAPKHFQGSVQGDSIAGTIHASAEAKDAVGHFSLRFLD